MPSTAAASVSRQNTTSTTSSTAKKPRVVLELPYFFSLQKVADDLEIDFLEKGDLEPEYIELTSFATYPGKIPDAGLENPETPWLHRHHDTGSVSSMHRDREASFGQDGSHMIEVPLDRSTLLPLHHPPAKSWRKTTRQKIKMATRDWAQARKKNMSSPLGFCLELVKGLVVICAVGLVGTFIYCIFMCCTRSIPQMIKKGIHH